MHKSPYSPQDEEDICLGFYLVEGEKPGNQKQNKKADHEEDAGYSGDLFRLFLLFAGALEHAI